MWVVAGVLLGLVVLATLIGFHSGPHAHVAAGVIGLAAAAWLVLMAAEGRSAPMLWLLLTADVVVSVGVGIMAWKGFSTLSRGKGHQPLSIEGAEGTALSDLAPDGVVQVRGEHWSATSVGGQIRAGAKVHVVRMSGVRLEVWGEQPEAVGQPDLFSLEQPRSNESKERTQ
jgi:membrane-bound ClpP family serine protease